MSSNRNNPVYWFERGSRGIVNVDRFDVGVGIVQIIIFLVGAAAVGVGSAGVSFIFISRPTPAFLNCTVEGRVGGQIYVDVPYFLTLAGALLCGLSIGIGLFYVCIKNDPCCFRVLYLGNVIGHIGWVFYGSIYLREAFSMWSNDQSQCSHLIMIMSAATLGVTALYMAILVTITLLAMVCGCYFKCCGSSSDDQRDDPYQ